MLDGFSDGAESRLKGLLEPGESILWTGRPQGIPNLDRAILCAGVGLVFAVLATLWTLASLRGRGNWDRGEPVPPIAAHNIVIATWIALFCLPIVAACLMRPLMAALEARRTSYALTDRRALILWGDMLGDERLTSYPPESLVDWKVERRGDGSGHLIFKGRKDEDILPNLTGFLEIPDVDQVKPLFRKMLACPFEIIPPDEPDPARKSPDPKHEPDFDDPVIAAARLSRLTSVFGIWFGTMILIGGLLGLLNGERSGPFLLVLSGVVLFESRRQPCELAITADHRLLARRASGASTSIPIADIRRVVTSGFFDLQSNRILIRHRRGTLSLPYGFDNFHWLLVQIRRINPAVEIDGL